MKRFLRILGALLLLLILIAIGGYCYLKFALPNVGDAPDLKVEITPERVAHGKHLATAVMGCTDCHSQKDYTFFGGPVKPGTTGGGGEKWSHDIGFPGEAYAPNITPYALKDWTDGEIYRAITAGVDKDGNALFPIMPYPHFGKMAKEDIYSVIAYLRTLPPVKTKFPARQLDFPLSLIVNTMPAKQKDKMAIPDTSNHLIYGKYLLNAAACADCHTPQKDGQYVDSLFMSGGMNFTMPNGVMVTSANLTPDTETGIGKWTVDQFVSHFDGYRESNFTPYKVKEGEYNTAMPWLYYSHMSNQELRAIFTYLKSIKPIHHKVEKMTVIKS